MGTDLLVLPSSAVLPRDDEGRVLLVQITDTHEWAAIGGAVEPDESPQACALREAEEEAGVALELGAILAVLGGPEYRMTYPNGDQTSYVTTVFDGRVIRGTPRPAGDETVAAQWWDPSSLPLQMSFFTRALLHGAGLT